MKLGRQHTSTVTHICFSAFDEFLRLLVKLVEVIAGVGVRLWFETEPIDNVFDRLKVLLLLCLWIGVIEPQVAFPAMKLCKSKIDSNSFGMANVKAREEVA